MDKIKKENYLPDFLGVDAVKKLEILNNAVCESRTSIDDEAFEDMIDLLMIYQTS